MSSIDSRKPRQSMARRDAHPERRSFPVVPTVIGVIVVVNVTSAILTLIK